MDRPTAIICHYPAGDGCDHCRHNTRHAHQWNNPYPTWYGEILPGAPGTEGLLSYVEPEPTPDDMLFATRTEWREQPQ